jgi:hypothetical protein
MQLVIDDEERASRARLARAYLERYPAGAHAVEAAEIYSLAAPARDGAPAPPGPPVAVAEAERLLGRVVDAARAASAAAAAPAPGAEPHGAPTAGQRAATERRDLGASVRLALACLRAGALDAALRAADAVVAKGRSPAALLVLAEVRHQRGENARALPLLDEAEAAAPPQMHARIAAHRRRYQEGGSDPGDTLEGPDPLAAPRPAPPSGAPPSGAPPQGAPPSSSLPAAPQAPGALLAAEERGAALRLIVERVAQACRPLALRLEPLAGRHPRWMPIRRVWARVVLDGPRVQRVVLLEPSLPLLLEACVIAELQGRAFPSPGEGEDTFKIVF